jgi:hypothetical protein
LTRWLGKLGVAAIVLPLLSLTPYLTSGTDVVKLRNAALWQGTLAPEFDWSAPPPADFAFDQAPLDPYFVDIAQRLGLAAMNDDWQRALTISRHLLGSHKPLKGGPVRDDLRSTHIAITQRGEGYCADFVRVFMAIASAAGMQVRAWAFSFDGFGGHGHTFPELWNRQQRRWQLVDLFDNYYFGLGGKAPLSALEFRTALTTTPDALTMLPLDPDVPPGWEIRSKALEYYKRGYDEWYLFWGSDILAVEGSAAFRLAEPLSYTLGKVAAVAQGVYPGVRPLVTGANGRRIESLERTRLHLGLSLGFMGVGALLLLLMVAVWASRFLRHEPRGGD